MKYRKLFKSLGILALCALILPVFASCNGETAESSVDIGTEQSESSQDSESKPKIRLGDIEYEISGINADSSENGIYIYNRELGEPAAEKISESDNGFFDVAIVNGTVAAIFEKGSTAPIPESGCVIRFRGQNEPEFAVGDTAKGDVLKSVYLPEKYFRCGDIVVPIGYENTTRTAEDTGFLFDSRWYSATTCSNIYCTEIAVADGKITEINRSGDNIGDTKIPEGGYVVAVGQGSINEHKVRNLKVGDDAELVLSKSLYTVERLTHIGKDRNRPDDGFVIYTDANEKTPPSQNLTEASVDASGRIIAVYKTTNGVNSIPEGGFVISASGNSALALANIASVGDDAVLNDTRFVCIITTPITELARLKKERDLLLDEFKKQVGKLSHIDFEKASGIISDMSGRITEAEATLGTLESDSAQAANNGFNGRVLAEAVASLQTLAEDCRKELVPSISVQDRTAWVTLGEYNYDNSILVHYKTREEITHAVAYAASLGLNTLIIDNIAAGYAVYPSKVEGLVRLPGYESIDYIGAFSEECKKQGIRLIVMVNAFSSVYNKVSYPENHYINVYKDKWLKTNKGKTSGPDNVTTLDPADPVIQEFNLAVIKEIAESYDIFGVQADYMRYPLPYYYQEHNYEDFGYNESSVSGFIKKYGVNPATIKISDPRWADWCKWRRDIISAYQKRFYQTVKEVNPALNVSFTCFADYNDRQKYVYQDVEKWIENGFVDAIYPMIYGADTEYQLGYANQILPVTEHTDLILGVGTYVRATHESLVEQLVMPYELCAEGTSNFTLRYISLCGYDETVRNAFRVKATPATASGVELTDAICEMLGYRAESLRYATRFTSEKAEESALAGISALGERIKALASSLSDETAESVLSSELKSIKAELESGTAKVPESVKSAYVHDIDYALGLLD